MSQNLHVEKATGGTTGLVRIDSNGNVGIGTSSPQFLLDVVSTSTTHKLRIGNAGSNNGAQLILAGSNTTKNWVIANQQNLSGTLEFTQTTATGSSTVDTTPSMVINSSGNVGIGTTSPSAKLEIAGFSTGAGLKLNYGNSSGTIEAVNFIANGAANGVIGMQMVSAGVGDLWLGGSGGRILTLYRDGNVGIGTSSPSTNLHIGGTAASGGASGGLGVFLSRGVTTNFFEAFDGTKSFIAGVDNTQGFAKVGTLSNHPVSITQNNGSAIYIDTSANVGIGTTSPAAKLHVNGIFVSETLWGDTAYHSYWGDYSTAYGRLTWDTGLAWINATAGNVLHLGADGGNKHITIATSGNVGIGTTSPSYKLDVAGQISMHDEAQDIDSRYYGATFLRGWQSFSGGNETSITYTTDTTCPVGIEVISVSTFVWARGPRLRLDKTQNYEVEIWIKRHVANTAGTFYFVVSNYDSSGNVIGGDGTDWHYPTNVTPPSTSWTKYTYIVGPYGGAKDHSSSARYISVGFIANYTGGTDVIYLTGFKCRPIPRYNNDALTLYNSVSVGIGSTAPTQKLYINGYLLLFVLLLQLFYLIFLLLFLLFLSIQLLIRISYLLMLVVM